MACAPSRDQRMPACFMRCWIKVLAADSTVPLLMGEASFSIGSVVHGSAVFPQIGDRLFDFWNPT